MINTIKYLEQKIDLLEEKIDNIILNKKTEQENGISIFNNSNLSLSIINTKLINITTIPNNKNNILFQININFTISSSQTINFTLLANDIPICTENNIYNSGNNNITITGTYFDSINDGIKIRIKIEPLENKLVIINSTKLTIFGITEQNNNYLYDAIETSANYILSYISNNRLYYAIVNKGEEMNNISFNYFASAISHKFCYGNNEIYLFRIDNNNNLLFSNFSNYDEMFIYNNVSKVSCCFFDSKIVFSFISNKTCYIGEIENNCITNITIYNKLFGKIIDCYLYHKTGGKIYLILTNENKSNYLIENMEITANKNENISSTISLNIESREKTE